MRKIEILSPAGGIKSIYTAFEAGADAVYFGVSAFNARKRAENIELKDIPGIVSEAYLRGISLYLTLNTLVKSEELPDVLDLVDSAMVAGIKCFIVQDYGILNILEKFYPEAEIHLSTQATTHLKGQIEFLSETSVSRVNLARELTMDEICEYTSFAHQKGIETEVFVHGSFCLSYSGQCYLSSHYEGLSGNRGLCAQLCRRVYKKDGKKEYFLNLKDNSVLENSQKLLECSVDSLKIEGRIKGPEYVYTTVRTWKDVINSAQAGGEINFDVYIKKLSSVFNRGFTSGYITDNITRMFSSNPSDASYFKVSEVHSYSADRSILETSSSLPDCNFKDNPAYQIMIKRNYNNKEYICSGRVIEEAGVNRYRFEIEGKLNGKIERGNLIYVRNDSEIPSGLLEKADSCNFRKIPVSVDICCKEGEKLKFTLSDGEKTAAVFSDDVIEKAHKRFTSEEDIMKQVSRFGNSPFHLQSVNFEDYTDNIFIPASTVNRLRRKAIAMFLDTIYEGRKQAVLDFFNITGNVKNDSSTEKSSGNYSLHNRIAVLIDHPDLLKIIDKDSIDEILFDAVNPDSLPEKGVVPVFPGIMTEEHAEKCRELIRSGNYSKAVINNTALINEAQICGLLWIAGNSLNILNHGAVDYFDKYKGCSGFVISSEAGRNEIESVSGNTTLNIYLPFYVRSVLMTTRQCLLGMKCGKSECDKNCYYSSCGSVELTDVKGKKMIAQKRSGSYTELYDSRNHYIPESVNDFKNSGFTFILDLRIFPGILKYYGHEKSSEIEKKAKLLKKLLNNIKHPDSVNSSLKGSFSEGNYTKGLL